MADYIKEIPNGTMMIRDTGGWVEFWFKTGASTWNNEQTWGYQVGGGGYVQQDFRLATGGAWQKFGSVYIGAGANQDVLFRIIGEGLGWPTTDHRATVQRQSVPPAPSWVSVAATSSSAIRAHFASAGDGGSPVVEWQLGYGLSGSGAQYFIGSNGISNVSGLVSGATYYFWARGRNALGWGPWSVRASAAPWRVPDAPNPVTFSDIEQTSAKTQFTFAGKWDGGQPVTKWQTGYGLSGDSPEIFVDSEFTNLTDLLAGRSYYFWGRAQNSVGWGPWSPGRRIDLPAGAWVKDQGEWRRAVQWVKIGGVWKRAKSNIPVNGTWKVPKS